MALALAASTVCEAGGKARKKASIPNDQMPTVVGSPYRIAVGDELEVSFFKVEDLTQIRTVGPDGVIHLALVGPVAAVGRTVDELTQELTRRYRVEIVDPQITVSVSDYSGLQVYVGGEVYEPGVMPYRGGLTAVQAIMEAGGFQNSARLNNVLLIRRGPDNRPIGSIVNVAQVLYKGRFDRDIVLEPTDVIWVPRTRIANVNKWIDSYIRKNIPIPVGFGFQVQVN